MSAVRLAYIFGDCPELYVLRHAPPDSEGSLEQAESHRYDGNTYGSTVLVFDFSIQSDLDV